MGTDAGYLDDADWHFLCMCVAIKISYKNILYSAADLGRAIVCGAG